MAAAAVTLRVDDLEVHNSSSFLALLRRVLGIAFRYEDRFEAAFAAASYVRSLVHVRLPVRHRVRRRDLYPLHGPDRLSARFNFRPCVKPACFSLHPFGGGGELVSHRSGHTLRIHLKKTKAWVINPVPKAASIAT